MQSRNCNRTEVGNEFRKLWSQHVYWTRMFIISTAEKLQDLEYVTARLLENPGDFADMLKKYYGINEAEAFGELLTEHLKIAGDLVNADMNGETEKANMLRKSWYENAADIALFLSGINPFQSEQRWRRMMFSHLDMTEKEAGLRLKKEYPKDIAMFEDIEREALEMADYMTCGIVRLFCGK